MSNVIRHVSLARQKAVQSLCNYKISAVGFDFRGKLLGATFNRHFLEGKGRGLHAEVALIKRYGKHLKTIMIMRVNNHSKCLPISPCVNCKKLADKLGIKIVSVK